MAAVPSTAGHALTRYVSKNADATSLTIAGAADPAAAEAALRTAAERIRALPSPYDPEESLPNWCDVLDHDGIPVLHLDMKDESRAARQVVRIVLDAVADAGLDGDVVPWRRPRPKVPYDPEADIFSKMDPLELLDTRRLPPGFPDGFPKPGGRLALGQRARAGDAEHAAWRRLDGPYTAYLDQLAAYGCVFGLAPRLVTAARPDQVSYDLWRDGSGGKVVLYSSDFRDAWYVSVVWHTNAQYPATVVIPTGEPDTRPLPAGRAAAREVAEYLAPEELVDGYETVMAMATAMNQIDGEAGAATGVGRATISGLTAVVRRRNPDPAELALLRHVCVGLMRNLHRTWGWPESPATFDDDGLLYDARTRSGAEKVVAPDAAPSVESLVELLGATQYVAQAMSLRSQSVKPTPDHYAWLFAGLGPAELERARDVAWRLARR